MNKEWKGLHAARDAAEQRGTRALDLDQMVTVRGGVKMTMRRAIEQGHEVPNITKGRIERTGMGADYRTLMGGPSNSHGGHL